MISAFILGGIQIEEKWKTRFSLVSVRTLAYIHAARIHMGRGRSR